MKLDQIIFTIQTTPLQFEEKHKCIYIMGKVWTEAVDQLPIGSFNFQQRHKPESEVKDTDQVFGQVRDGIRDSKGSSV